MTSKLAWALSFSIACGSQLDWRERHYDSRADAEIEFQRGWLDPDWVPEDARGLVVWTEFDDPRSVVRFDSTDSSVRELAKGWSLVGPEGSGRTRYRLRDMDVFVLPAAGAGVQVFAFRGDPSKRERELVGASW